MKEFLYEVVKWSEQLRSVTSVWLGAVAAAFKSDSAPAGVGARKMFGVMIILMIKIVNVALIPDTTNNYVTTQERM